MALVGNGVRLATSNPNRSLGSALAGSMVWGAFGGHGARRNFYGGDHVVADQTEKAAFPDGYRHPHAWIMPPVAGALRSFALIEGEASITASGAMGVNGAASIAGLGQFASQPSLQLIVSAAAALTGSGSIDTADLLAVLQATAALTGAATVSATRSALGGITAAITGSATVSATRYATGTLEADILPYTELSPQALAQAVWDALAVDNNDTGTMGEKLNDAGSAGDPWATNMSGYSDTATFGGFVRKLLTVGKFLGLK